MKLNKQFYTIAFGAALFAGMVGVVAMTSPPEAPEIASANAAGANVPVEKSTPIILASAHTMADPRASLANIKAALPQSIPVPCPIWILGQLTGYSKTTVQTADGSTPNPKLVPGGIWLMQKFTEAVSKTL